MSASQLLTIGELAHTTGVTIGALRHYDETGVVTPACRIGGKRRFTPDSIGRVHFVRRAQAAGFTLAEIRSVLTATTDDARDAIAAKLTDLRHQRRELDTTISVLESLQSCDCSALADCPAMTEAT